MMEPGNGDTKELASKMVLIQNKRFYLDVKKNDRGLFVKVAEVSPGGNKSRLTLSMATAAEFRDLLGEFIEHYAQLGPSNPDESPEERQKPLKTERLHRESRRYFLDLKENNRGRYLRIRQQTAYNGQGGHQGGPNQGQGGPGGQQQPQQGPPPQIVLPAQGMIEFRDTLTGLIDEFGKGEEEDPYDLPKPAIIGDKKSKQFFLDPQQNQRGMFLQITEQTRFYRQTVSIPEKHWGEFADYFCQAADKMEAAAEGSSQASN